jgi:hypothetical protein
MKWNYIELILICRYFFQRKSKIYSSSIHFFTSNVSTWCFTFQAFLPWIFPQGCAQIGWKWVSKLLALLVTVKFVFVYSARTHHNYNDRVLWFSSLLAVLTDAAYLLPQNSTQITLGQKRLSSPPILWWSIIQCEWSIHRAQRRHRCFINGRGSRFLVPEAIPRIARRAKQRGEYGECSAAHSHTKSACRQIIPDNMIFTCVRIIMHLPWSPLLRLFFTLMRFSAIKMIVRALQLNGFITKHLVVLYTWCFMLASFN